MKNRLLQLFFLTCFSVLSWSIPNTDFKLALIRPIGSQGEKAAIDWTALRRIPEIMGIPHSEITAPGELRDYSAAILAAGPANNLLTSVWREALYSFVDKGGVLLIPGPVGSQLYPLMGIESIKSNKLREEITFNDRNADPVLGYINHPNETTISLGNGNEKIYSQVIWSHGATPDPMADTLAVFPDGSAALLRNYYGRGVTYYLGVSFEETVMLPQTGGDYEAQRLFVNSVEPSADVIMLLVKAFYQEYVPFPVCLTATPEARSTALLLSHDVDAQTSFADSLKFASLAEEFGTRATFFINTKYFTDAMDIGYYTVPANIRAVRELARRGHEIGSHTVTHSLQFTSAPPGTPDIDFARYQPQKGITINGEVRVSRELLDRDINGQNTRTFRAGYLAFPPELISILESSGYSYDSSFSANDVLTSFPYFAFEERRPGAAESEIIEIPVTLDDALEFLTEKTKYKAAAQWKEVVDANADNGSITVLLVHPSDTRNQSYKLEAQRDLMNHAAEIGAWMGPMKDFGDFWRSRHATRITTIEKARGSITLKLNLPEEKIHPLTGFELPNGVPQIILQDSNGHSLPLTIRRENRKTYVSLQPPQGP